MMIVLFSMFVAFAAAESPPILAIDPPQPKILIQPQVKPIFIPKGPLFPRCCPCSHPEIQNITKIIEYVVKEPDVSRGHPNDLVYKLINILTGRNILDKPTASSILITFRVPVPQGFPDGGKPLTEVTIHDLPVRGNPEVKIQFIQSLVPQLNRPSTPGLIKSLVELILNNHLLTLPQLLTITIEYGIVVNVKFVIPHEKIPKPRPTSRPVTGGPGGPFTRPVIQIEKGTPGGDSTVIIQIVSPNNVNHLIEFLIDLLSTNKIIDQPTQNRLVVTFVGGDFPGVRPFGPSEVVPIAGGNPQAKDKFLKVIVNLIKNPKSPNTPGDLIKALLEFLIDNGVVNPTTAANIAVKFGISVKINVIEGHPEGPVQEPTLKPGQNPAPNTRIVSTVTIKQVVKDLKPLIRRLVELSIKSSLIPQPEGSSILATFNIQPGLPGGIAPVTQFKVNGNPEAGQKFIVVYTQLAKNPSSPDSLSTLVKILAELLINNATYDHNSIAQLLQVYGVGSSIDVQFIQTQVQVQDGKIDEPQLKKPQLPGANLRIVSTITIKQVVKDLKPLIKRLVELIVQSNLIPQPEGNSILATFNVQPGGSPLTVTSVTQFKINGHPEAGQKFIKVLTQLVQNPTSANNLSILVKILAEFLIDTATVDHNSIAQLLQVYGVGSSIDVQFIQTQGQVIQVQGDIKEPALNKPQLPGAGLRINSVITIKQVVSEQNLKLLIKRLVELSVQANLIPQSMATRLLVTFHIVSGGGSPLTAADFDFGKGHGGSHEKGHPGGSHGKGHPGGKGHQGGSHGKGHPGGHHGGHFEAHHKAITALKPLLSNPSASSSLSALVKILAELLIDSAVYDHNGIAQFLVAYGVAVEIRVEYVQIQVRQRGSGGKSGGKGHGGHIGVQIGGKSGRGGIGIKVGGSGGRSHGKKEGGGKLRLAIGK